MVVDNITFKGSSGGYDNNPKLGLPRHRTVLLFEAKNLCTEVHYGWHLYHRLPHRRCCAISVKYLARSMQKNYASSSR